MFGFTRLFSIAKSRTAYVRKHGNIIFSFKVCKIATHSCMEQAAGSYSRPGNIHEFPPFSPSSLFYKCPFRIPGPLLIVTVNANTAEHAVEDHLPIDLIRRKCMFSLVVSHFYMNIIYCIYNFYFRLNIILYFE